MTSVSLPFSLEVSGLRPVHPVTHALLGEVCDVASRLGISFVVAGATARDLVLWHVYGVQAERATRDVDVAVCAVDWRMHAEMVATLQATGRFTAHPRLQHSLIFSDAVTRMSVPLDLVPFGELERPAGSIAWPPGGDVVMNVLGFREAVASALAIDIGERLVVPVASLPALTLLKLLAWRDRRTTKNTDASDLLLILRSYYKAGNAERLWTTAPDLLEAQGFDIDLAAAALLGREARAIASAATRHAITRALDDARLVEMLVRDMRARAAGNALADFDDDADRLLSAFRSTFLTPLADTV